MDKKEKPKSGDLDAQVEIVRTTIPPEDPKRFEDETAEEIACAMFRAADRKTGIKRPSKKIPYVRT